MTLADHPRLLAEIAAEVRPLLGQGRVADYIPLLAKADPSRFGLALAALDGERCGTGDCEETFSIQSISKVFALALTLPHLGEALWRRVGKEPSGNPFNSLVQLEYERGLPRSPFINAGSLVVTDALLTLTGDACGAVLAFLRSESGCAQVAVDEDIAESEWRHRDRNAALAHFIWMGSVCSRAVRPSRSTPSCSPAAPTTPPGSSPTGWVCPVRAA